MYLLLFLDFHPIPLSEENYFNLLNILPELFSMHIQMQTHICIYKINVNLFIINLHVILQYVLKTQHSKASECLSRSSI